MTVIEIVTVMVIISILVSIAAAAITNHQRATKLETLKGNAVSVMQAVQSHYEAYCQRTTKPPLSTATLISDGFLDSRFTQNPFGPDISPNIVWGTLGTATHIEVIARINSGSMDYHMNMLDADRISGRDLIWSEIPAIFGRRSGAAIMNHLRVHAPEACL